MKRALVLTALLALVALVTLGPARIASAQPFTTAGEPSALGIGPLFPFSSRSGLTPIVLEVDATTGHRDIPLEVDILGGEYGRDATRVRTTLPRVPGARREFLVPGVLGYGGFVSAVLPGSGSDRPLASSSSFGSSPGTDGTLIAVMGLGTRIAAGLSSVPDSDVHAGAARSDPTTGETIWPGSWIEWGGIHVVVAGAGAYLRAPPAARRALSDFVLAGGTLVLSPRTAADLNDPLLQEMIGPVHEGEESRGLQIDLRGDRLQRARFGGVARFGLGAVIVLRRDLSLSTWGTDPLAEPELQDLVRYVAGRGGAVLPAGELGGISTLTNDYGSMASVLRPEVHLRGPLVPISILLFVYVIGLGVLLQLERRRGTPLRAFTRVPVIAIVVMGVVIAIGYIARGRSNSARALVVYETAAGSTRALMHTFAGLTAGHASTMDVTVGAGRIAFAAAPERGPLGVARWTGDRISVEGMRLGIWETAGVLLEGVEDLGGAVTIVPTAARVPRVHNGTRFRLAAASVVDAVHGRVWRFAGAIGPGETMDADPSPISITPGDVRSISTFGARATMLPDEAMANTFLNVVCPPLSLVDAVNRIEFWAVASRPAGTMDSLGGFQVEPGPVLLRVVGPEAVEAGERATPLPARTVPGNFDNLALPSAVTSPAAPTPEGTTEEADAGISDATTNPAIGIGHAR